VGWCEPAVPDAARRTLSVVHGTIVGVTTVLFYLVVAGLIGLVVFFLAVFVFGRGEQMAALDPRTSPAELPEGDISAEDVRTIRFALALRGYRMSDVDWTLERLGEQLDQLRRENATLRGDQPAEEDASVIAPTDDDLNYPSESDLSEKETVSVGASAIADATNASGSGEQRTAPFSRNKVQRDAMQSLPDTAVSAADRDEDQ
jgi:DivIVA domain-containing protein